MTRILSTELHDFRKMFEKMSKQRCNQNPDFSADLLEKTSNNFQQKHAQNQDFAWGRGKGLSLDLSLDLEMKAGVGGIGRSRVETYSLDYIFLYILIIL